MSTSAQRSSLGPDYWLSRCEGFRVRSADGRKLGLVEAVVFESRPDQPDWLLVRAGLLGRRLVPISTSTVAEIQPREQRIIVRPEHADGGR